LDPRLKNNLSLISPQQHATAVEGLKQMMSAMSAHLPESSSSASPQRKKPKLQDNFFGDLYTTRSTSEVNEVTRVCGHILVVPY